MSRRRGWQLLGNRSVGLVGSDGYAFYSPLETVYPGDSIFGYTEMNRYLWQHARTGR